MFFHPNAVVSSLSTSDGGQQRQEQCPLLNAHPKVRHFHSVVTPVIVAPGQTRVIPLAPEFVVPQDGHDKQDCENAAAKRWLSRQGQRLRALNVTVLGDDLYCHQPLCQQLLEQQLNFILVCRRESHATLYEHLEGIEIPTITTKKWTGKVEKTYTYRYLNGVPLRDTDDALLVNWCELTAAILILTCILSKMVEDAQS